MPLTSKTALTKSEFEILLRLRQFISVSNLHKPQVIDSNSWNDSSDFRVSGMTIRRSHLVSSETTSLWVMLLFIIYCNRFVNAAYGFNH